MHKRSLPAITVIGGGTTMIGAPCFVAAGALRVGCGLVRLVVPAKIISTCLGLVPSAIGCLSRGGRLPPEVVADAGSIIAAGPGLGLGSTAAHLVAQLIGGDHPLVLDGDALTHVARGRSSLTKRSAPVLLTPHPGEYGRLAERWGTPRLVPAATHSQRRAAARALALASGAVVVLKGRGTVVSDGRHDWTCLRGGPALAIPGSGDVLTGVIAGLLAQGLAPYAAACLGVDLHGRAGDCWTKRSPVGLLAMELADLIPLIVAQLRRQRPRRAVV